MSFLVGLFLGCTLGFLLAGLCNAARKKTLSLPTASRSSTVMGRAA
ncbi:MAG: hypothetical protein AB2L11_01545 [Syntrophobacteraceae bacterium]